MSIRRVRPAALAATAGAVLAAMAVPATAAPHAGTATSPVCTATWDRQPVSKISGTSDDSLLTITGVSPSSLYATGQLYPNASDGYSGRVLRNSGSGWTDLALPELASDNVFLRSSTAPGSDEAWVGGSATRPVFGSGSVPVLLHVVGSTVSRVPLPSAPAGYGSVVDNDTGLLVDSSGGSDLWATASYYASNGTGANRTVLYRPVSGGWSQTVIPTEAVNAVEAVTPTTAYIAGQGLFRVSAGSVSRVALPGSPAYVLDITSTGPADVWVLASTRTQVQSLLHFDGSSWATVPLPATGLYDPFVRDIAETPNGVLWVTGTWTENVIAFALQWWVGRYDQGTGTWAAGPASPDLPIQDGFSGGLSDLLALSGGGIYAAGVGPSGDPLVLRQCHFSADATGLTPAAVRVKLRGDAVLVVADGGTSSPRVSDTTGLLSVPPLTEGEGAALRPDAAGTYQLVGAAGGSGATLGVPVQAVNGPRRAVTVYVASSPAPAGYSYELQALTPGASTWRSVGLTASTGGVAKIFHPGQFGTGTYSVRGRVTNTTTGIATGWSPAVQFQLPGA